MPALLPLFIPAAVDVSVVITVVLIIFAIIGWLRQLAENQPPPPPARRPPRPRRPDDVQNEIDQFLREVGGGRRGEPDDVVIEIVPEQERRPRPEGRRAAVADRARSPRPGRRPPEPAGPRPRERRPVGAVPEHEDLGRGRTEPVVTPAEPVPHLAPGLRPPMTDQEHLPHLPHLEPGLRREASGPQPLDRLESQLSQHLVQLAEQAGRPAGAIDSAQVTQLAALQMPRRSAGSRPQVAGLFRDRESLRQAILINAILTPPRARKR